VVDPELETDPIDDLMDHLEALLVDPERDTLTLRADESGGLQLSWASRGVNETMKLDRVEPNPRLMLLSALRLMRQATGR